MSKLFTRTSVTIDEAVAIMLGWVKGPIEFRVTSEADYPESPEYQGRPDFCLEESLLEEQQQLESDLLEAQIDNKPAEFIAEMQAAIQAHLAETDQAKAYLTAINDEINKGERSVLRVDTKLSNALYTYITLSSLDNWAEQYGKSFLAKLPKVANTTLPAVQPTPDMVTKPKPRTKMRDQEAAILKVLHEHGYDPKNLSKNEPGQAGVKAVVRYALETSPLFGAGKAFDKAWERLAKQREIIIVSPPPHK